MVHVVVVSCSLSGLLLNGFPVVSEPDSLGGAFCFNQLSLIHHLMKT